MAMSAFAAALPPEHLREQLALLKGRQIPLPLAQRPPMGPDSWGVADHRYRLAMGIPSRAVLLTFLARLERTERRAAAWRGELWVRAAADHHGRWCGVVENELAIWLSGVCDALALGATNP